MVALAHKIQAAIDAGVVRDRAEIARLGFTRTRITHLLDLLLLAPDLQEQVLLFEAVDGVEPLSERALGAVAHAGSWAQQRAAWEYERAAGNPASSARRKKCTSSTPSAELMEGVAAWHSA